MAFLDQHPGLGYPAAAALGLLIGSFLNVVILRLPKRLEWQWKRDAREVLELPDIYEPPPPGIVVEPSHCPHCKHKLSGTRTSRCSAGWHCAANAAIAMRRFRSSTRRWS